MRCVSLRNIFNAKNLINFSSIVYHDIFKPNKEEYCKMWSDQGPEFWVKFVVTLKYYLKCNYAYYEDYEGELVTFLKALTQKKFTEIHSYIENAANKHYKFVQDISMFHADIKDDSCVEYFTPAQVEQMKYVLNLTLLAGTFIQILPKWEYAKSGNEFDFVVPKEWTLRLVDNSPLEAPPLESFIRSKWGGSDKINQILGCEVKQIVWWKDLAPEQSQINKISSENAPLLTADNIDSESLKNLGSKKLMKLYTFLKENHCFSKQYWMRSLNSLFPASFFSSSCKEHSGIADICTTQKNMSFLTKDVLNSCCSPILHQKYFKIDIALLASKDYTFLKVAPWFALILESTGVEFMHRLLMLQTMNHGEDFGDICHDIARLIVSARNTKKKFGTMYTGEECVEDLADFLFEPCVLIELPSMFVLMRQWLCAAIIVIYKFELEIVEFAHWPIPEHVEPSIRHLMSILVNTKEIILLGFFLTNYEIVHYPCKNVKFNSILLDDVVLRSLPVLKFICSEEAYEIVKCLKTECFKQNEQYLSTRVQLHESVHSYKSNIGLMVKNFFGHFLLWTVNQSSPVFTTSQRNSLLETIQVLKTSHLNPEEPKLSAFYLQLHCKDTQLCSDVNDSQDYFDTIDKIFTNVIIPCGHFSEKDCKKMLIVFSEVKNTHSPNYMLYLQTVRSALCYWFVCDFIETLKHDTGIVSFMARLSAQIYAKEMLAQIVAVCCLFLDQTPRACTKPTCHLRCHISETTAFDRDYVEKKIMSLYEASEEQLRSNLWEQFPEEWKESVSLKSKLPSFENSLTDVISSFEVRIGRLVWNATKGFVDKIFEVKTPFPYLNVVHYILPCLVSSLLDVDKLQKTEENLKVKTNIVNFLNNVILYFETSFDSWTQCTFVQLYRDELPNSEPQDLYVIDYNMNISKFAMHGFMLMARAESEKGCIPHFYFILQSIPAFSYSLIKSQNDMDLNELKPWIGKNISFSFKQILIESCLKTLPLSPNSESTCPRLQKIYFASMVIYQMMAITYCHIKRFVNCNENEKTSLKTMSKEMDTFMYELFTFLFQTKDKTDYDQEVSTFIEGKRIKFLKKFFDFMNSFRKYHVGKMQEIPLLNNYNSTELERSIKNFYVGKNVTIDLFENIPTQTLIKSKKKRENSVRELPEHELDELCSEEAMKQPTKKDKKQKRNKKSEGKQISEAESTTSEKEHSFVKPKELEDSKKSDETESTRVSLKKCNNCDKLEETPGLFMPCPKCITKPLPKHYYFCDKVCFDKRWEEKHSMEHIQFEIGLLDL